MKRGEIWLVALDPAVGSQIKKSRPCVIVSPPELGVVTAKTLSVVLITLQEVFAE